MKNPAGFRQGQGGGAVRMVARRSQSCFGVGFFEGGAGPGEAGFAESEPFVESLAEDVESAFR